MNLKYDDTIDDDEIQNDPQKESYAQCEGVYRNVKLTKEEMSGLINLVVVLSRAG